MVHSEITGGDLFADLAEAASGERFESLLKRPGVSIVRIVSNGQATPRPVQNSAGSHSSGDARHTVVAGS